MYGSAPPRDLGPLATVSSRSVCPTWFSS